MIDIAMNYDVASITKKKVLITKRYLSFLQAMGLITFLLTALPSKAQIEWPLITQEAKPWTRWWWQGSAVNEKGLTWNLEQYAKSGLGGVEITPIYGVYGTEKNFVNFLSPNWMQLFSYTLNESKRLGLGVDLANGTGWPFGGPWVKDNDASKAIFHKEYTLLANQQMKEPIRYFREGFVRTANGKSLGIGEVKYPIHTNPNLQEMALDQVQFAGDLPLIALMAYDEKGKAIDITNKVDDHGQLNWIAPATSEKWNIYALFQGLHGKMVERAAPGGEGYAIDHFSQTAAQNYFKKFDEAFKGYDISYLRSFFNDSYEVDDARGDANWTPLFFDHFKKIKGYDLRHHLPALFGKDQEDKNKSVIYDYRSVIDELLLEQFTKEWKRWGEGKGKMLRNQSHGSPANTLDLYGVVDIPETEGTDVLRFKFASSAANVTGKKLVSSESATWLNEHFLSSWSDVKKAMDLFFLGGVNHVFYHGTNYSPQQAKWPGWLFYAAVHFQPENPQWKHFHALNKYIARVQSFLQNSKSDNDLLVYYPIADCYSNPGNNLLQHFDGMARNFVNTDFEQISKKMVEEGYSFDFFSDRQLKLFSYQKNQIITEGNRYKAILLPQINNIPEESMAHILKLVKEGAALLVHKSLPKNVPGWYQSESRTTAFNKMLHALKFEQITAAKKAKWGNGTIYISDDLNVLAALSKIPKEKPNADSVYLLRRKNDEGKTYFINNRSSKKVTEWVKLTHDAASVLLFNPATDEKGIATTRKVADGGIEVFVQLDPHASIIVQTKEKKILGNTYPYQYSNGETILLNNKWEISFLSGGPVLPASTTITSLGSWTDLPVEAGKDFSGVAKYTTTFAKPKQSSNRYLLDLGIVHETAEVRLNGQLIATLIGPTYTVTIPNQMLLHQNKLEFLVANKMANRIAYMDRNNIPWKIFYNTNMPARRAENVKNGLFDAAHWKPVASGLLGPVSLTPLK